TTPLLWAVLSRQSHAAELLLANSSVDVNAQNSDGRSPLTVATEHGYENLVELLLQRDDVNVNIKDNLVHPEHSCTPLCWAAWNGHEGVVRILLLRSDLVKNKLENVGDLPLNYAIQHGHSGIVQVLLD
ncbi:ankyrin, partial [Wilcoxina mikolae CBS 423.85]